MLYHLLYPLSDLVSAFNVFRYITFRSIYAIVTALVMALILAPPIIRWLKAKSIGEKIRGDGPQSHLSKAGTPTMGGLIIFIALVIPTIMWADYTNSYVLIALTSLTLFAAIGFYDDYVKLTKTGKGISVKTKLAWQVISSLIVVALIYLVGSGDEVITRVHIPFFKDLHPDLGMLYFPFAMVVIVGAANAVNLTDGLDGLAIGPIIIAFVAYLTLCYAGGHVRIAEYLNIPYKAELGELTVFCSAVIGAALGFLWYNFYPATIFMGNVGSLALGGALGSVAVMSKNEIILIIVGGVFVIEAMSVMIQVTWYRFTGKRFFKMAPIHHHFEQMGWPEPQVIIRFWVIAIILALLSLSTLKLR